MVHVRNGEVGLWGDGEGWRVEEVFRLGGADGREEVLFGSELVSVTFGPRGNTYVLDFDADHISVFDGSGVFVRQIGRSGQGPAEFESASVMAWDRLDRLWVADPFRSRYTGFDSTGAFVQTVPRPIGRRKSIPILDAV